MEQLDLIYQVAMDKLKYKFNSLSKEFSLLEENNPIEHIKYRIKKKDSIEGKLKKKNLPITEESIRNLNDILGVRVVCSFLDDVEVLIKTIESDPEITILKCKNYIDTPKNNGYMSYHLNIEFPVLVNGVVEKVKAEIQVRTIAMDMWASLEHKIWYKKGIELPEEMTNEIYQMADFCKIVDERLNVYARNAEFRTPTKKIEYPFLQDKKYSITKLKHEAALKIMEEKIQSIVEEYGLSDSPNPIEHVKSRLKSDDSIGLKLQREQKTLTVNSIEENINDFAGIRIVCSFKSDVEKIVTLLKDDATMEIVEEQDYITYPKDSGYKSYHLLVNVPIYLQNGVEKIKVEIQIRTIAMDMWASLEHKLCYHKEVDSRTNLELKRIANVVGNIDESMEEIIKKSRNLVAQKSKKKVRKKEITDSMLNKENQS
ncbi:MAG: hypothetical protein PUD25_06510 [Bacilli bacterium]|nr:hypothetical protein [Bacilli bacterium]